MVFLRKIRNLPLWVWSLTFALASGAGLVACGGSDATTPVAQVTTAYTVALSGDQEQPAATTTGGLGTGSLTLASPSLVISGGVTVNGITATMAHIHQGAAGTNGPVIVPLTESAAGSGVWTVATGTTVTQAQAEALLAGGLYFNVHTAANPGGDVRGQIGRDVFAVQLSARQEVPPNTTTASARGLLVLDPVSKKFSATVTAVGMTSTAAHIHTGAVGANGGVTFPFTETSPGSGVWTAAADASMTDAQIATLKAGGMYFNVHSAAFTGGQVRGQIGRNVGVASMTGAQEVPAVTTSATGTGTLVVDPATRAASGGIVVSGITPLFAHIHLGATGANGPVIVPLTDAGGGVFNVPAGTVLTADQFSAFKLGNLYFNAHSTAFASGEIRGQIR
jgi:hypothetical protein